jgi:chemotaxis protein methyltransferase CheR
MLDAGQDAMRSSSFARFCAMARELAGLNLKTGKEALVSARVAKRQRALAIATPEEYLERLESGAFADELPYFIDVITTHVTAFWREADHFEALAELVRQRVASGVSRLRLWCAAASTGEEAYSMAMAVADAVGEAPVDWRILATDISRSSLAQASQATYGERRIAALPAPWRERYLYRRRELQGPVWEVRPELRQRVIIRLLNLARPPFPMRGPLEAVFLRNVMIYLRPELRTGLLAEIERLLASAGLLFVGHAETLGGARSGLTLVRPSVYARSCGATADGC